MSLTHNTVEHVSIGVMIHVLHRTVGIDENRLNLPISEIGRVFKDIVVTGWSGECENKCIGACRFDIQHVWLWNADKTQGHIGNDYAGTRG